MQSEVNFAVKNNSCLSNSVSKDFSVTTHRWEVALDRAAIYNFGRLKMNSTEVLTRLRFGLLQDNGV